MARKPNKIRAELRRNRTPRPRSSDWTRKFQQEGLDELESVPLQERIGKDELTRRRTVVAAQPPEQEGESLTSLLEIDRSACRPGRVLSVLGLLSLVQAEDGTVYRCVTRRLLKTISTVERHVVAAGDRVWFRPAEHTSQHEGIIEAIEPRRGVLSREVQGRQHVVVTNIDQVLVVASAAEPPLKPNLIDRLVVAAEKGNTRPVVCINKVDLVDIRELMPLAGVYARMGYPVLLLSALTGFGLGRLRRMLRHRSSAVVGQSGVGKSSLLNALEPSFRLATAPVSRETEKGRHTTTNARLLPLSFGGYVVDTPGMRQFQLWDVIPEEVVNYFRDFRPYVNACKFPDCSHTHESHCAVKDAVADGRLDCRRYESYLRLRAGETE